VIPEKFPPSYSRLPISSSIIQQVERLRDTGLALITYFYCDFRDTKKQEVTGLLTSLIVQLSAKSEAFSLRYTLISMEDHGGQTMTRC